MKSTGLFGSAALLASAIMPITLVVPTTPAIAGPAQDYCEDVLGGVYSKSNGVISCTVYSEEYTGNGHGQLIESIVYTFSNGTWNNDPQAGGSSGCDGPGGSGNKSNHC